MLPGVERAVMRLEEHGRHLIRLIKGITELTKELYRLNNNLEKLRDSGQSEKT